jgi:hypothetical protein
MEKRPRKNRKSRDTPKIIHELADKEFENSFGWKVRSNGVFAISDPKYIDIINNENLYNYLFFPIGNYKFVCSIQVKDFYNEVSAEISHYSNILKVKDISDFKHVINLNDDTKSTLEHIVGYLVRLYSDRNLSRAILSEHEVAFKCKSYYLVDQVFKDEIKKGLLQGV